MVFQLDDYVQVELLHQLDSRIVGIRKKGTRGEPRRRNPLGVPS